MKLLLPIRVLALVSDDVSSLLAPRISAAEAVARDVKNSGIEGTVYTVDSDGNRSEVPAALVRLSGPSFSRETVTNGQGRYSFLALDTNKYQIDAMAPGLSGSTTVTFVSGATLEVPVELKVEAVNESVTVTAGTDPLFQRIRPISRS